MWDLTPLAHGAGPTALPWTAAATAGGLSAGAAAYVTGLRTLGNGAVGRGIARHGPVRVAAFGCGLATAGLAALFPPGGDERFAGHMAQHMLLIVVAAPLLAAGAPGLPLALSLPVRARRWLARRRRSGPVAWVTALVTVPVTAWLLHVVALWSWHMPAPFDAALHSEAVHVVEHLCLIASAWLFWWHILRPGPARLRGPVAALFLFATLLPSAALGAVLTLARAPLYAEQAAQAAAAGADPLADQQLAGLVMWIPADVVYLVAIMVVVLAWLSAGHRRAPARAGGTPRRERHAVLLPPEEVSR